MSVVGPPNLSSSSPDTKSRTGPDTGAQFNLYTYVDVATNAQPVINKHVYFGALSCWWSTVVVCVLWASLSSRAGGHPRLAQWDALKVTLCVCLQLWPSCSHSPRLHQDPALISPYRWFILSINTLTILLSIACLYFPGVATWSAQKADNMATGQQAWETQNITLVAGTPYW